MLRSGTAVLALVLLLPATTQAQLGEWQVWRTSSCHEGLDFSVRKNRVTDDGRGEWRVRFRNRYRETIHFSYVLREPGSDREPSNRMSVRAGDTRIGAAYFYLRIPSGGDGQLKINSVRLNDEGDIGNYKRCGVVSETVNPAGVSETVNLAGVWETDADRSSGTEIGLPSGSRCTTTFVFTFRSRGGTYVGTFDQLMQCAGAGFSTESVVTYTATDFQILGNTVSFRRQGGQVVERATITEGGASRRVEGSMEVTDCVYSGTYSGSRIDGQMACPESSDRMVLFRR